MVTLGLKLAVLPVVENKLKRKTKSTVVWEVQQWENNVRIVQKDPLLGLVFIPPSQAVMVLKFSAKAFLAS